MKENPNLFLKVIAFTISILILMIGIIKIIDKNLKEKKKKNQKDGEVENKPKNENSEFSRLPDPKGKPTIRP
jgi:hypothetical protein